MKSKTPQTHGSDQAHRRGVSADAESYKKLTVSQCRRSLASGIVIADAELTRVRDELYQLAEIALEGFREREQKQAIRVASGRKKLPSLTENRTSFSMVPEIDRESVVERAAILEFEGGCTTELAERQALLEWAGRSSKRFHGLKRRPAKSSTRVQ